MSWQEPTEHWSSEDIDRMLEVLAEIEAPGFVAYRAREWPRSIDEKTGVESISFVGPDYHPVVQRMWDLLYETSAYIDAYARLPEDSGEEGVDFSVTAQPFEPEYFKMATLNQVRRYLVLCTRGERFCDGHIAAEFDRGSIPAALRRLRELSRPQE